MAGFWKRDKGKDKKRGKNQVVLPDIPISEPRSQGLKGEVEPLTPLIEDAELSRQGEEETVRLDNDTKMGVPAEGGRTSRHIEPETGTDEETVVLGAGTPAAQAESKTPPASDEETVIVGRNDDPSDEQSVELDQDTKADQAEAPEQTEELEPIAEEEPETAAPARAKTLAPELMENTDQYADILPAEDEAEEDDEPEDDGAEEDEGAEAVAPTTTAEAPAAEEPVAASAPVQDEEATRIIGGRGRRRQKEETLPGVRDAGAAAQAATPAPEDAMADPIVGWLVIIDGPGMGHAMPLGYGTNPIGRAPELRVPLMFGDGQVSRGTHATVIYDPRGRTFYVQHGGGTNLTYLDDKPLLEPKELSARDRITIGDTVLMLVPLCGEDFDWQDQTNE